MAIHTCPNCGAKNRVNETIAREQKAVCGKCGAALTESGTETKPQVVTDRSFAADVIGASSLKPVLVEAWAEWCGPCHMIAPVLDQLAGESAGRYKIAKLNIDENPRTAAQFNIRSIPTLLIFKNGSLVDQIIGVQPKQAIAARLATHT